MYASDEPVQFVPSGFMPVTSAMWPHAITKVQEAVHRGWPKDIVDLSCSVAIIIAI